MVNDILFDHSAVPPPQLKRVPTTLTSHGDTRVDDYHWLREREHPDVAAALAAENAYTTAMTASFEPFAQSIYDEMLGHIEQTDVSAPYRFAGAWYYTRTQAGQQYPIFCRRVGSLNAPEEIVLDVNALAVGKPFLGLGAFVVSDDGHRLAYTVDETGYRQYALRIKDLRTGDVRDDGIERVSSIVWADDRTLFYATEDATTKRSDTVWAFAPGSPARIVYAEPDELFDVDVRRSRDGASLFIHVEARDTSEVWYLPSAEPVAGPRCFAPRRDGVRYDLNARDGTFYVRTNDGAPDFAVFTTPVGAPETEHWRELVAQRPGITITGVELFATFVVIAGRRDGLSSLELLRDGSSTLEPLTFDEPDYAVNVGTNEEFATPTFRFTYESLVTPKSTYDLDVTTGERTLVKRVDVPKYDPAQYRCERVFFAAEDGTRIPVSLVSRGSALGDAPRPLLLYGYGSYGVSIDPAFAATRLPLLDRGVTFAIAHIRGGGEYGEAWRLAGNLMRKRTTFDDFIACAQGLVEAGYTSPDRLAIQGGSAGGLLVGAVVNARPELFGVAVAQVPFVDVLTTMLDPSLPLTTGEYREWGDPNDRAAYAYMRSYSPVDNVRPQPYPAMLVEVSLYDSQVPYWEGMKFAARVRENTTSGAPILVRANLTAGHGGASGRYDAIRERAFVTAFILRAIAGSEALAASTAPA